MFPGNRWYPIRDGDERALALYLRHYSARPNGQPAYRAKNSERFIGPTADYLALMTTHCDALFVWRKDKYRQDKQTGVLCHIFRNEGPHLSSDLILEAEELAWHRWPGEKRLFTFVDPGKVASPNPGYCFKMAGWRFCGKTKSGKKCILEKYLPAD